MLTFIVQHEDSNLNKMLSKSVFNVRESLLIFLVFLVIIYLIYYNYKRVDLYICGWKLPGPFSYPILGSAWKFMFLKPGDVQPMIMSMNKEYGHLYRFWLGPELNVVVTDPKCIEKILSSNCTLRKGHTYKYIQEYLGLGLLSAGGTLWKQQRKHIAPVFNKKILEGHLESFNIYSKELVENLKPLADGKVFNVFHEMADSVNKTVCETLLGVEPTEELKEKSAFAHHIEKLYAITFLRMTKWWYQFDFVFENSSYFKTHQEVTGLLNIFYNYIHNQKFSGGNFEKNKTIALDTIVDPHTDFRVFSTTALTLQTASEESISTILSFMLMILGIQKDIQKKMSEELEEVFGDSDRFLENEDLTKLKYLDLLVKETLRMFPIGSFITRCVEKSFPLTDKLILPKDCVVTIPIFTIHRNSDLWEEPNKFIPERFLPENLSGKHPLRFLPFSYGPMNCIGQTYALWCIKVVASTILRYYEIDCEYNSLDDVELMTDISIRPVNGYLIKLLPKKNICYF